MVCFEVSIVDLRDASKCVRFTYECSQDSKSVRFMLASKAHALMDALYCESVFVCGGDRHLTIEVAE